MQDYIVVGQAIVQVLKNFWLVIPLSIIGILYVNKLDKEVYGD